MMGTNVCYSCGKLGHMVKDCLNRKIQEQGSREFSIIVQVKRLQGGTNSSHSSLEVQGMTPIVKSRV